MDIIILLVLSLHELEDHLKTCDKPNKLAVLSLEMFAPFMLVEISFSEQVTSFLRHKIFKFAHKLREKTFTDSSRKISRRHLIIVSIMRLQIG